MGEVLEAASTDPSNLREWIFTNAPRFYGDIGDLANYAESFADIDAWGSACGATLWQRDGAPETLGAPTDLSVASVQVRSLLDSNLHPVPPQFGDPASSQT